MLGYATLDPWFDRPTAGASAAKFRDEMLEGTLKDSEALAAFATERASALAIQGVNVASYLVQDFGVFVDEDHPMVKLANAAGAPVAAVRDPVYLRPVGESGYKPEYRDHILPRSDQAHHFAAFFQFGYVAGEWLGRLAAILTNLFPDNPGDRALGQRAAELGPDCAEARSRCGAWVSGSASCASKRAMQLRALLLLLFVLLAGCRRETRSWRIAWSPDGRSCVAVAGHIYLPFLQEHLGVEIGTPSFRETIVRDVIDAGICFVELAWSADSRVVAGFLHPCDRRSWIRFAYDTWTRRRVDPEVMKDRLREAIRENYAEHLRDRPGLDPLGGPQTSPRPPLCASGWDLEWTCALSPPNPMSTGRSSQGNLRASGERDVKCCGKAGRV